MSFKKLWIFCEGQCEEKFVNEILSPRLSYDEVQPYLLGSKKHKGGSFKFEDLVKKIRDFLKTPDAFVSTMYDFYEFPKTPFEYKNISELEKFFEEKINNERFIPYISLHEFETLLFSDVSKFETITKLKDLSPLEKIVRDFGDNIENINSTASPSSRIEQIFINEAEAFKKITDGVNVAKAIGIKKMLEKSPHFKEWVEKLENLCKQ